MTISPSESILVEGESLRRGYTTGVCATAATKAAAIALLSGVPVKKLLISVYGGNVLSIDIENTSLSADGAVCTVKKDGGDDVDATHGALISSHVSLINNGIIIDGGEGVGRVTKKGLDQPVGAAAINSVPRRMITDALNEISTEYDYEGGFSVLICVPEGREIAEKTFNPRLGIEGGISILGTTGIVEPMSIDALIKTIKTEMDMRHAEGYDPIVVSPGNYGRSFAEEIGLNENESVLCGNYIGEMLDHACHIGSDILLIGNMGKMVKVAGGIMNTHSRQADARMEIMAAYAISAGASSTTAVEILSSATTDSALELLIKEGVMEKTCELLAERIDYHINHRTRGKVNVGVIVYSTEYGLLAKTPSADNLLEKVRCRR